MRHTHDTRSFPQIPVYSNIIGCHGSSWLYKFRGIRSLPFSFLVTWLLLNISSASFLSFVLRSSRLPIWFVFACCAVFRQSSIACVHPFNRLRHDAVLDLSTWGPEEKKLFCVCHIQLKIELVLPFHTEIPRIILKQASQQRCSDNIPVLNECQ